MRFRTMLIGAAILAAGLGGCAQESTPMEPSPVGKIVGKDELATRLAKDPAAVLQEGLAKYDRDVVSYTCTLYKQERVKPQGPMGPQQKMACKFMGKPFSVYIDAVENPIGSRKNLYVQGKRDNKMLVQPAGVAGLLGFLLVEARGAQARDCTLQFIDQFGLRRNAETMVHSCTTARKEGIFTSKVLGTETIEGRDAIVYEATITEPKPTGRFEFARVRVWLDRQWLLPTAVTAWDAQGIERGRYRYADINFKAGLTEKDFLPEANGMKLPRLALPATRPQGKTNP